MQKFTCAIGFLALVLVLQDFWVPAEGVRVKVIKVKKDKRQAQRGYTDVPLDEGPFEEIENSSPLSTDFGDRGGGSDSINDSDNTQVDYSNGYPGQSSTGSSASLTSIDTGSSSTRVEVESEPLKTAAATIDEQKEESCEGCNAAAIPGDAGLDYPNFSTIPQTSFSCKNQEWPGYYADTEARCQVFWICQKNRMDAFLCPNGTLFNQQVFVCDWWFNVDCNTAPDFYTRNQYIYAGPGIGIDGKKLPSRRTNGGGESASNSNRIITTVNRPAGTNSNPLVDRSSQISKNVKITSVNNNIYQESASAINPVTTQRTTAKTTTRTTTRTTTTPKPTTTTSRRPPPPPIPVRKNTGSKSALSFKESSSNRKETLKSVQSLQKHSTTTKQLLGSSANSDDTFARNPTNKYGPPSQAASSSVSSNYGTPERDFTPSPPKESSSPATKSSKYTEPDFTPPPPPRETSAASVRAKYGPPPPQGSAATLTKYGPPDYNPTQSSTLTSEYGAPGFIPGQPQNFVDESRQSRIFISTTVQPNSFNSLDRKNFIGFSGHGQRSNQFNNINGQRENMYSSSFKNSVIEYPISPSQQKNKQRLLELASRKDSHMDYQHFHGQRSNAFSDPGASSISYTSINNKNTFIDHTAYTGKKNIFSTPVATTQKQVFIAAPTSTTPRNYVPVSVSTTSRPYFETSGRPFSTSTGRPFIESSTRPYIESSTRAFAESSARPYIESTARPHLESAATHSSTYTVPDGYAALHAGSYVSIATSPTPGPFSKKILLSAANSKSFAQTAAPKLISFTTSTPRNYHTITPTASSNRIQSFSSSAAPTVNPYFTTTGIPNSYIPEPRYVSGNNNYIVSLAPTTQAYPVTTSAGHRQNTFTGHSSRRHNSFSTSGFSNTINYPGGVSETNVRFGGIGGSSTKRNIVDFSYTASPISSTSTPYPSNTERFSQVISTTSKPHLQSTQNSIGTTVRYVGTVTNKSTNQNQLIYVDPADTASSHQAPVSTSPFGNRISGSARKRMTGAWQNYFSDN